MIDLPKSQMNYFVNYCLHGGAIVKYIPFNTHNPDWPGFCNPSVMWDEQDKEFKMILRNVNYILHDSKKIWSQNISILYSNPDKDNRNLKTQNWLGRCKDPINEDFEFTMIATTPYEPQWEFQGQEDGRILRWKGQLISTGVRRDDNTVGRGRMEVMFLDKDDEGDGYHQSFSAKVPAPGDDSTYCEKNWMPIQDQPYRYVRMSNPTQVISVSTMGETKIIIDKPKQELGELDKFDMVRGSSQVIPYKDGYIALVHTCTLWWTANGRKVAKYYHAFIMWDNDWNIIHHSPVFSFGGFDVEFTCGMEYHDGNFYIPFAINDNVPFLLIVPQNIIYKFICGFKDEVVNYTEKTPFYNTPEDCQILLPNVDISGIMWNAYIRKEYNLSYAGYMRNINANIGSNFINHFMAARSIADIGGRDAHEISMWIKSLESDPDRPESYFAIAMFYYCRYRFEEAYFYAMQGMQKLQTYKGPYIYYTLESMNNIFNLCLWQTEKYIEHPRYNIDDHIDKKAF